MRIHTPLMALAFTVALLGALMAQDRKFYPDDPLWSDDDMLDVPDEPAEVELSDIYDRFGHIGIDHGSQDLTEAHNVNTVDELPDNSWFTNRHARTRMSIEELVRASCSAFEMWSQNFVRTIPWSTSCSSKWLISP